MKQALIAVNFIGFIHFLWDDIDLLNEMGYKVYVTADNGKNETDTLQMLTERKVTFIDVRIDSKSPFTKNNIKAFLFYRRLFYQNHFNVIHCHTPIVGLIVRLAARQQRKLGTKVIYTTHGLAFTHLSSKKEYLVYHTIESFASRFCDGIITINKEDYENARKLHCNQVFHINGVGVDIKKYSNVKIDRDEYREKLGISKGKLMILSIGELSIRKNHQVIVKAINCLPHKDDYVFAICGREMTGGGTANVIRQLAKDLNIEVIFLGFRHDIAEVIHCADIGAIPSIREGLGLAGIETLSVGIPLVGSDVQGIREYIVNGKTGYLCNPWDVNGYAKAIQILSDNDVRKRMKPYCLNIVKSFDKEVSVEQRRKIYNILLEK